ncbi:MAG: sulfotransferase domain-containing protein [Caulobacteraceae bacterium]
MPASEGPPQGIVWLASYPKSGNTWTRTFLHNLLGLMEGDQGEHDINEINEFTTWDLAAKRYEPILGKSVLEAERAEIAAARPLVQAEIAAQTDGLSLVKTHHALVMDRGQPTLNFAVTTGAVYLVRNPLDIAVSFAHHMGTSIDVAIAQMGQKGLETAVTEKSVYEVYGSWSEHVRSWTAKPHRAVIVARYEDMLADPFTAFSGIARHLLLRAGLDQIDEAIARSSFDRLKAQEDARGFREKPESSERFFREGKAGGWRKRLSRRQIRQIVRDHRAEMARFGYLTDDIAHLAR